MFRECVPISISIADHIGDAHKNAEWYVSKHNVNHCIKFFY